MISNENILPFFAPRIANNYNVKRKSKANRKDNYPNVELDVTLLLAFTKPQIDHLVFFNKFFFEKINHEKEIN